MCGGQKLLAGEPYTVKEIAVPSSMIKNLIFVVDLSEAAILGDEVKALDEMKEDIIDALGVSSPGNTFEAIFAGYDGLERQEITDTDELTRFFAKFENLSKDTEHVAALFSNSLAGPDSSPASKRAATQRLQNVEEYTHEAGATKAALNALKLGNIITKVQMGKFVRRLVEIMSDSLNIKEERDQVAFRIDEREETIRQLRKNMAIEEERYKDLEDGIEARVATALRDAKVGWEEEQAQKIDELKAKFAAEKKEQAEHLRAEAHKMVENMRQKMEEEQAELRDQLAESKEKERECVTARFLHMRPGHHWKAWPLVFLKAVPPSVAPLDVFETCES